MIEYLNIERGTCSVDQLVNIQLARLRKQRRTQQLTAVHVGAYIGNVDTQFITHNRDAVVYAIEPCKRNFKLLCDKAKLYEQIKPCRLLIGDSDGTGTLYVTVQAAKEGQERASSQSNSMYKDFSELKEAQQRDTIKVKQATLASFIRSRKIRCVDYLRLNCEGGEYKIFDVGQDLSFLKKTNIIAITMHGKSSGFLTEEYAIHRMNIETSLHNAGLQQIYGLNFSSMKKLAVGHVWQVWSRLNFVG